MRNLHLAMAAMFGIGLGIGSVYAETATPRSPATEYIVLAQGSPLECRTDAAGGTTASAPNSGRNITGNSTFYPMLVGGD